MLLEKGVVACFKFSIFPRRKGEKISGIGTGLSANSLPPVQYYQGSYSVLPLEFRRTHMSSGHANYSVWRGKAARYEQD
jgi:hypothetical protein